MVAKEFRREKMRMPWPFRLRRLARWGLLVPMIALAQASDRRTVGATAPSATRASTILSPSSRRLTAQPTTAMSISVRGMNRR